MLFDLLLQESNRAAKRILEYLTQFITRVETAVVAIVGILLVLAQFITTGNFTVQPADRHVFKVHRI
jgi:ABC-type bacteriocin/lantibiotic exporter with double-glycine peptidase domain